MKDTLKYVALFVATLVVVIMFNQLMKDVNGRTPFEVLFGFGEKDYDTNLFDIEQIDMAELRTDYYNVDFLMSINKSGEQYLAIYPYVIEAGYDLTKVAQTKSIQDATTTITFPAPEIESIKVDNKRNIMVIRSADVENSYINMLDNAFRNRARDIAFERGICDNAQKNAEVFFRDLFPDKKIVLNFAKAKDNRIVQKSNKTPIEFVFREDALNCIDIFTTRYRKIQTDDAKVYFNPADMFLKTKSDKEITLYYYFETSKSIDQLNKKVYSKSKQYKEMPNYYWIKYYDPLKPKENKIVAELRNGDDDHNLIGFSIVDNQYCFDMKGSFKGEEYYNVGSDLFYLAMSAKNGGTRNESYNDYLEWYDKIIQYVNDNSIAEAHSGFKKLRDIKKKNDETELNYPEIDLQAYIDLNQTGKYEPIGYEPLDNLLEMLQVFSSESPDTLMTPKFQEMFFMNYSKMDISSSDVFRILEYFCTLPQTTAEAKKEYYNLLSKQGYYSNSLLENISEEGFCRYFFSMLHKYDEKIVVQDKRIQNLTIIGYESDLSNTKYSRNTIEKDFLAKYSLLRENKGQLVLCLSPDGLLGYDKYPLVIFEKDSISIVPDYCPLIFGPDVYSAKYKDVRADKDDDEYTITVNNEKQIVPEALYKMLSEIEERESQYVRFDEWKDKMLLKLRHKINNYCNRPEPML